MEYYARDLLMVRQYAYNVLNIIFGQAPTESILSALLGEESLATLQALVEKPDTPYGQAFEAFAQIKSFYLGHDDMTAIMKSLKLEYTRLFAGPNKLPAPPWELVYKTGRLELFQPGVLELRAIYRSAGCLPAEVHHVSDDHLGIELDFLRFLCEKTIVALENNDEEEAERLEAIHLAFLQDHLLVWVPKFLDDFQPATEEPLYVAAGLLLRAFIELDARLLEAELTD